MTNIEDTIHHKKKSWLQRLFYKYRLVVIDEHDWTEKKYFYVSRIGVFFIILLFGIVIFCILSLFVYFTPLGNISSNLSKEVNRQLISESERLDSLTTVLELQEQYLETIRKIVAGDIDIKADSVISLDSMQLIMQAQLLESKKEVTEDFLAQYEAKEHDNILVFELQQSAVHTLFKPVTGTIIRHYSQKDKVYNILLETADKANVYSINRGIIVDVSYGLNATYSMAIMHPSYVSVYRNLTSVIKQVGERVEMGELIGFSNAKQPLEFSLWQNIRPVNPEEVIAF